jgi:hypothetical protein
MIGIRGQDLFKFLCVVLLRKKDMLKDSNGLALSSNDVCSISSFRHLL